MKPEEWSALILQSRLRHAAGLDTSPALVPFGGRDPVGQRDYIVALRSDSPPLHAAMEELYARNGVRKRWKEIRVQFLGGL
jgi:predicted alpha/beta-hydrolase family hydrolase